MRELTAKFIGERNGLENQIRNLKSKILEHENKYTILTNEIARKEYELNQDSCEIEAWRGRYSNLEKNHSMYIEELEMQFDSNKKFELEMIIRELTSKHHTEKLHFENQIKLLKNKNFDAENKINLLTNEVEKLNNSLMEKLGEIDAWKGKYQQLEKQFALQIQDINHQNEVIKKSEFVKKISKSSISNYFFYRTHFPNN